MKYIWIHGFTLLVPDLRELINCSCRYDTRGSFRQEPSLINIHTFVLKRGSSGCVRADGQ